MRTEEELLRFAKEQLLLELRVVLECRSTGPDRAAKWAAIVTALRS